MSILDWFRYEFAHPNSRKQGAKDLRTGNNLAGSNDGISFAQNRPDFIKSFLEMANW